MTDAREEASVFFPRRAMHESKRVRLAISKSGLRNSMGRGILMTIWHPVVRAKEVSDLHVLKEGFGLTLEGKALSWF